MELDLLEKTEIHIQPVKLLDANLSEIARVTALVLGLSPDRVQVIDVREDSLALDILQQHVQAEQVFGKGKELLEKLSEVTGLTVFPETQINSSGILGYLELEPEYAKEVTRNAEKLSREIRQNIARRVLVFPSGYEVQTGMIEDTNTPYLLEQLQNEGYKADRGEVLPDDLSGVVAKLKNALDRGYGLIITTGGVGAEDKDFNVEAMCKVTDVAWTPYIIRFTKGQGRHIKDGVRIGVGQAGITTIVNLPGPHEEVRAVYPTLHSYLHGEINGETLARRLAEILRKRWEEKFSLGQHHH